MKLTDIEFDDDAFKTCVLETGVETTDELTELRCRDRGIESAKGLEQLTALKLLDLTHLEDSIQGVEVRV